MPDAKPGLTGVQVYWGVPDAVVELARLAALGAEVHEPVKDVGGGIGAGPVRQLVQHHRKSALQARRCAVASPEPDVPSDRGRILPLAE
jgi:hypothetical protein